jgi:N-acetylmuramoyl-L-alanine amidase
MIPRLSPRPLLVAAAAALLAGAGCSRAPQPVSEAAQPAGYVQLRETFGPRDFTPLMGRRIVLDPGHGGHFRGAIGPGGLAEADVNLGVALYLRGLLEWAGAEVAMTRTADYDFLSPADSSLTSDLAFRVSFTDSIQPDVFISLHHNSTATGDPTINETQTYYPLGDDGASVDLAQAVHRHLVLNLEISPARILPGNFHVLRRTRVPAILGEPAMISHPEIEGRLSRAAAHRLEAEAYFLGLLDYFAGGAPAWRPAQPDSVAVPDGGLALAWTFVDSSAAAPPPDPATFTVRVDGRPEPAVLSTDGTTLRWRCPEAPASSPVTVTVTGRNIAGRRTPPATTVLLPGRAAAVAVTLLSDPASAQPRRAHLDCRTPDGRLLPSGQAGWPDLGPAGLLPLDAGATRSAGLVLRGSDAPQLLLPGSAATRPATLDARVLADPLRLAPAPGAAATWHDRLGDAPVLHGAVALEPGKPLWREAPGMQPLARVAADLQDTLAAVPVLPALVGRTVVIDPAGGGTDSDGDGPLGLRGADVNLAVARRLGRLLEGCGARAVLTRDEGDVPTPSAKAALADAVGADLFLTVGRSPDGTAAVSHHPGSVKGEAWAGHAAAAVARLLPGTATAVRPSWSYLLRHTACPALDIRLPGADDAAADLRLGRPAWQAAEARALLLAAAALAVGDTLPWVDPAALLGGLPGALPADAVDWARWDGNLPWYPLPAASGPPPAAGVPSWREPGLPAAGRIHHLEVHGNGRWQLWRLERGADDAWTGTIILTDADGEPAAE